MSLALSGCLASSVGTRLSKNSFTDVAIETSRSQLFAGAAALSNAVSSPALGAALVPVALGHLVSVALDVLLLDARDAERAVGHVLDHGGPGRDHRPLAHPHRRHQLGIRAHLHAVVDHGLELLVAVVVAGDGAGADVDARADGGVAQVAEVVGLAAAAQARLLGLHEGAPGPRQQGQP